MAETETYVLWFEELDSGDTGRVGGKNSSLGEMIQALKEKDIRVPDGFATTADAYWKYVEANELEDELRSAIEAFHGEEKSLEETGEAIRELIRGGEFPEGVADAIREAYVELGERYETDDVDVAVRSSATATASPWSAGPSGGCGGRWASTTWWS
jgi:pyruvate, water dikinase